ncbi:hypothetical protein PVAND_015231 [Polypedilum vanderplanki]|uniref:Uncharacterized protein n=1 Tax=Polypedilum vanderplanki TaxID=319348 RepID=A0A9J6BBJ9_POLVA|nr:hypothetical protein PVAND_015231 [Polypedilum vanderplanki]
MLVLLVPFAAGHRSDEKPEYEYECGNKFYRYYLDDEPAEYGLSAGYYAQGKTAYIGLSIFADISYIIYQLQLDPPGVISFGVYGRPASFFNDSKKIWYLYNNWHHDYHWVDSQNGEIPSFAIKVGEDRSGFPILIGRIKKPRKIISVGVVVPSAGYMSYADDNGMSANVTSGYQVLTCKSAINNETKYPTPYYAFPSNKDDETGCMNNWQQYNKDDAPVKNGIEAGEYDCNNKIYVGKVKNLGIYRPARIQIYPPSVTFIASTTKLVSKTNESYYLIDNPNYTYYWIPFDGTKYPSNAVYVRNDVVSWKCPIGRVKINGHMKLGNVVNPIIIALNDDGIPNKFSDYEILVCDPWPKYKCTQQ